jgi:hypothetical protein
MDRILIPLNFQVNLAKLISYYEILKTEFRTMQWNWIEHGADIKPEWQTRVLASSGGDLPYGWGLQSNLKDINIPCPPYDVSIHNKVEYRDTNMIFGDIERLKQFVPYSYRWSIAVQPPNGSVARHTDQEDEDTIHIPIITNTDAVFNFNSPIHMPANGSAYLLHTEYPHDTVNRGSTDRVHLIFRIKKNKINELLSLTGQLI